jgi:outer membrane protein OmpA-like peptidoglycan-associated protein
VLFDLGKAEIRTEAESALDIATEGFGEEKPAAPNMNPGGSDNTEGRAQNRRV